MRELTQVLADATGAVEAGYFHLNIDGGDPVYRERVYCYELYHQMRLRWPVDCPFILNGEVDKAAHPFFRRLGAGCAKPDLLVHQPGSMRGNHAIIEVKSSSASNLAIQKDLDTLSLFINEGNYQRAIYLIYGRDADGNPVRRIEQAASRMRNLAKIELWVHPSVGACATNIQNLMPHGSV